MRLKWIVAIARAIAQSKPHGNASVETWAVWRRLRDNLAQVCGVSNPKFDRGKWWPITERTEERTR